MPRPIATALQRVYSRRAREFLAAALPLTVDDFKEQLIKSGFQCVIQENRWDCTYTKSRPPRPCVVSYWVSVEVDFPYQLETQPPGGNNLMVSERDIDVAAMAVPDPDHPDSRGCLPL
jgi:hypothetical protein